jgi:hypothetical protein
MDTEFEDLVADSMRWRADAVTIPPGLAGMASRECRRHRRRQLAIRGALGAGTAIGTAAAVVAIAAGPQQGATVPLRAQTAAYILSRAESALAGGSANTIEYVRVTGSAGVLPVRFPFLTDHPASIQAWFYRSQSRYIGFAADGSPIYSERIAFDTGSRNAAVSGVAYGSRTWWRTTAKVATAGSGPVRPGAQQCAVALTWIGQALATGSGSAVSCPRWTIAGREQADGVSAIKLIPSGGSASLAIWVDAATYRPVRILDSWTTPRMLNSLKIDIRWLPPTRANLASLRQPIPPAFQQIPGPHGLYVSTGQ